MFRHFNRIVKDSAVYGFGQFLNQAAGFILIPIYVRYLDPAQYGILAILTALISVVNIFSNVGQTSAFLRYFYKNNANHKKKEYYTASLSIVFLATILIEIVFISLRQEISQHILKESIYVQYIIYIVLITLLNSFSLIPLALFRAERRVFSYTIFSFLKFAVYLILNIYFVVFLQEGVGGILKGYLYSTAIFSFAIFVFNIGNLTVRITRNVFVKLLKFGLPFLPTQLSDWILHLSDRIIMTQIVPFAIIGVYNLGYKVAFLVNLFIIVPFQLAWGPFMYQMEKENEAPQIYANTFKLILFLGVVIATMISIFSSEIIRIIAPDEYYSARFVVPLVSFAYVLLGCYYTFTTGLNLKNKTYYFPFTVGIPAIINILSNFYIIPLFPLTGAAFTTLIAHLLMSVFTLHFSQKYYYIPFPLSKATIFLLTGFGVSLGTSMVDFGALHLFILYPIKLILTGGIVLLAMALNIFPTSQIKNYLNYYFNNSKK